MNQPNQPRIAVYTVNFGNFDPMRDPAVVGNADYVYFTDGNYTSQVWNVTKVQLPIPRNPILSSRYYFNQSTLLLPDYAITVEHGADVELRTTPETLVEFLGDKDVACFLHPHRTSVYEEGKACVRLRKDVSEKVGPQMSRYEQEGFPGTPLSTCILLVRRNTEAIREFEQLWWHETATESHRNQLSFDYARWKCGLDVSVIPGSPYARKDIMVVHRHPRR